MPFISVGEAVVRPRPCIRWYDADITVTWGARYERAILRRHYFPDSILLVIRDRRIVITVSLFRVDRTKWFGRTGKSLQ